jgi:hypothetical protein
MCEAPIVVDEEFVLGGVWCQNYSPAATYPGGLCREPQAPCLSAGLARRQYVGHSIQNFGN